MPKFIQIRKVLLLVVFALSLPIALELVSIRTNLKSRAGGESANLVVDASTSFIRKSYVWKNFAQGGEEQTTSKTMFTPVVNQVKKLKPEYIRVDHVYDFYSVINKMADGSLTYDWAKFDVLLDEIKFMGAKPFLSLHYDEADKNFLQWQQIVQKTIEHVSGERGFPDVYYEIWNEPDLFGGWKLSGSKSYIKLYQNAVLGARRAKSQQSFKIGGPATTALYQNWFITFLEYLKNETLEFDFYSWHRYSTKLDDFEADIHRANVWREQSSQRFSDIEFVISEVGHDSEVSDWYDNRLGAIHSLATMATLDGKIDKAFSFEIKDGPGPGKYWGRWGILTHEKYGTPEEKDRFKAFEFLQNMEGKRLNVSGSGSWVKAFGSEQDGSLKLLIANYDSENKHSEAVPIQFLNLPKVNYTYRRTDFLGRSTKRLIQSNSTKTFSTVEYMTPNSAILIELLP